MNHLKNTQSIKLITMKPVAFTKCVIGQDWYRNELEIVFEPGEEYPDYIDVNNWVMEQIDGQEMNIEDVVDAVYKFLLNYNPRFLKVRDYIKGCKTHFDVIVEK